MSNQIVQNKLPRYRLFISGLKVTKTVFVFLEKLQETLNSTIQLNLLVRHHSVITSIIPLNDILPRYMHALKFSGIISFDSSGWGMDTISTNIENTREKYLSPFGMAFMQLNDTISIEPEFSFLQDLQPSKQRPEYWNNLGSSKSRSVIQEKEARKVIEGIITEAESETVFVFTDGSCKGNPGPCGAGACLFFPNQEKIELHQPVAKRASIYLSIYLSLLVRSYMSITPGSANLEILIK